VTSTETTTDRRTVDERREELIEAAIDVLTQHGLARTTTRAITDRAGLALGAFHYAFRSKDDLLEAVAGRLGDQIVTVLADAGQGSTQDVATLIEALVTGYWTSVERAPTLHLAVQEVTTQALREHQLRAVAVRLHERQLDTITDLMAAVPDPPSEHDRADLARTVLASLEGLTVHALVEDDPAAARRRLSLQARAIEAALNEGVLRAS
jgi:AcrR family transcriptional regulator